MQNKDDINQQLAAMVATLAQQEGFTASALDYVHFMRSEQAYSRTPVMYEPCICIIVQGRKRAYLGEAMYTYDARQYLVVSAPMPFEADTEASAEQPMLGIHLGIQQTLAAELALAVQEAQQLQADVPANATITPPSCMPLRWTIPWQPPCCACCRHWHHHWKPGYWRLPSCGKFISASSWVNRVRQCGRH
ncbi:hypothetical protein UNDKW_4388 [Undibacterium sp. KW1]|uniref:AraC family transcriptional regulator n=1 Tax=Undibacterium sp. KW1 TaxID=2058624 RepID=UPI001331F178|nr:hypothetical protein UNDKW_4388 [Undibacterium sp. KW1]